MASTDNGDQEITFKYGSDATGVLFNKLFNQIITTGIYGDSPTFTKVSNTSIEVSEFVSVIYDSASNITAKIETTSEATATVSSTDTLVVVRFSWSETADNYADIFGITDAELEDEDVVLGRCVYSGEVLESFDYSEATLGSLAKQEDVDSNTSTITTLLGRTITVSNGLSGGGDLTDDISISGDSASTTQVGVVQLYDGTDSSSTSLAATANSVGELATTVEQLDLDTSKLDGDNTFSGDNTFEDGVTFEGGLNTTTFTSSGSSTIDALYSALTAVAFGPAETILISGVYQEGTDDPIIISHGIKSAIADSYTLYGGTSSSGYTTVTIADGDTTTITCSLSF